MSLSRREIILSAPAVPILAMPTAAKVGGPPTTVWQIVRRLDELSAEHDALFSCHAVPFGPGRTAISDAYVSGAAVIEEESERLVQLLVGTRASTAAEIRLKARIVGEHNVFPCPADLCPADALFRSLLLDLGVHGA
jgi:hypothetical protein